MPELPEVETIRRALVAGGRGGVSIIGYKIKDCRWFWKRILRYPSLGTFKRNIRNQRVNQIRRRGKYILFSLDTRWLIIHLGMSGDLLVRDQNKESPRWARMHLILDDNKILYLNDPRKFSRVWLVKSPDKVIANLGPEPFDSTIDGEWMYSRLHHKNRQIKPLLLDQTFVAGIGNIYADEALFMAGIHPLTKSNNISVEKSIILLDRIRYVLEQGIRNNGSSFDWAYQGGEFQNSFKIHRRNNEPCDKCSTPIEKITVGQRGTYYCPNCQLKEEEK